MKTDFILQFFNPGWCAYIYNCDFGSIGKITEKPKGNLWTVVIRRLKIIRNTIAITNFPINKK